MKVRAYVLIVSVALFGMSAGSKKATLTEGFLTRVTWHRALSF